MVEGREGRREGEGGGGREVYRREGGHVQSTQYHPAVEGGDVEEGKVEEGRETYLQKYVDQSHRPVLNHTLGGGGEGGRKGHTASRVDEEGVANLC